MDKTVSANFEAIILSGFNDVLTGYWADDYIYAIYQAAVTVGCGSGNYCPDSTVTREQMAAFLVRAVDGEPPADYCGTADPFPDVSASSPFCKYIKRLMELNITQGCGAGLYCPAGIVTREQMAAFIVRAVERGLFYEGACAGPSPFSDVLATSPFCKNIERLVALGVTQGCAAGTYCPSQNVLRDQMAAFLARAFLGMQ
jgi:hypothetical protein